MAERRAGKTLPPAEADDGPSRQASPSAPQSSPSEPTPAVRLLEEATLAHPAGTPSPSARPSTLPDRKAYFEAYPEERCHAHSKRTGLRCWSYVVEGYTVCRMHGANPTNHGGRPPKGKEPAPSTKHPIQGRYEAALAASPGLGGLFKTFLADDDLTDLQSEIALLRAIMAEYLQLHRDQPLGVGVVPVDLPTIEAMQRHLITLTEGISRAVERKHKLAYGEQHVITVPAMAAYAARIAEIINSHVRDLDTRRRIAADLAQLFGVARSVPTFTPPPSLALAAGRLDGYDSTT